MADELANPVVVEFPLRGEGWLAVQTPGSRIPSHGVDMLGQRYAYDLLKVDQRQGLHHHPGGSARGLLIGVPTRECYAWGSEVHSPFDGQIVRASDGMAERSWIHPLRELALALKNGLIFNPSRLPLVLGNYVIARMGEIYAGFAHLAPGSVQVVEGQRVDKGDVIGHVGHTGNSTAPHLHFQLMDSPDLMTAQGIPCAFRAYEVQRGDTWVKVEDGIPTRTDRIRSISA